MLLVKGSMEALKDQVLLYSLETKSVFTDEEKEISDRIDRLSRQKNKLRTEAKAMKDYQNASEEEKEKKFEKLMSVYRSQNDMTKAENGYGEDDVQDRCEYIKKTRNEINQILPDLKGSLRECFKNHTGIRVVREEDVGEGNIISVFESVLTRTFEMHTWQLYRDIVVVRAYYYDVLHDIMVNGFLWGGEKYVLFGASAGQIRTKKVVFVKEKTWDRYKVTIMCGLTIERINQLGGVNPNKFNAYLALANGATVVWDRFNIMKTIVISDFETLVPGVVDFVDDVTYESTRMKMDVPIPHTDGAGMVHPRVMDHNCMIRIPWVKGLLCSFDFVRFIMEADEAEPGINHGLIKDIYGIQHDVVAEGIEIIFTESQFKMHKYYESWEDYQKKFVQYDCVAGICNEEEEYVPDARLTYQMLQTLPDMTDEELEEIAATSNRRIKGIAENKKSMLRVFGATKQNKKRSLFQECLMLYPELLQDDYTKETLKQIKKRLVRNGRSGKLDVNGKYLFLMPDMYAACEFWFKGIQNPNGLLRDGEVSSQMYEGTEEIDCLRSPHLYHEHAIRRNVVNEDTKKWYPPLALVTSCHDLISKILMFDCDGDKSLVIANKTLIEAAKRNGRGLVPLYYNMAKSKPVMIDNEAMYKGMIAAYTGGKIGIVSNNITKVWNSPHVDYKVLRALCMENNFVIDYAKTLYKPERPADMNERIVEYTSLKTPHFFIYAKDKTADACEVVNDSVVNRLERIVENPHMRFKATDVGRFDFRMLMHNKKQQIADGVVEMFEELDSDHYKRVSEATNDGDADFGGLRFTILNKMEERFGDLDVVCDSLIRKYFRGSAIAHKSTFWLCFAGRVLENLKENIPYGSTQCMICGRRFIKNSSTHCLCDKCRKKNDAEYRHRYYEKKKMKENETSVINR